MVDANGAHTEARLLGPVRRLRPHGTSVAYEVEFQDGTMGFAKFADARRERAGYIVAAALGFPELVPLTVLRELNFPRYGIQEASVQPDVDGTADLDPELLQDDAVESAAIFDAVVAHQDRFTGKGNWIGVGEPPALVVLLDQAEAFAPLTLAELCDLRPRSVFLSVRSGQPVTEQGEVALDRLLSRWADHTNELGFLLRADEVAAIKSRADALRRHRRFD